MKGGIQQTFHKMQRPGLGPARDNLEHYPNTIRNTHFNKRRVMR